MLTPYVCEGHRIVGSLSKFVEGRWLRLLRAALRRAGLSHPDRWPYRAVLATPQGYIHHAELRIEHVTTAEAETPRRAAALFESMTGVRCQRVTLPDKVQLNRCGPCAGCNRLVFPEWDFWDDVRGGVFCGDCRPGRVRSGAPR